MRLRKDVAVACFKINSIRLFHDNIPTAEFIWSSMECQIMNGEQGKILKDAENYALLGCYSASSGNFLVTFRVSLSVPSSGFSYFAAEA
jgi:hypothetical protein